MKSGFLTFCFAFLPGAGQMYRGYMKRGISIMAAFGIIIALTSRFSNVLFSMMLMVVWFAAFFDTFRIAGLTDAQRDAYPDDWLWNGMDVGHINFSQHRVIGVACILLGIWMLLDSIPSLLGSMNLICPPFLFVVLDYLPPFLLAVALVLFGLRFVVGPHAPAAAESGEQDIYTAPHPTESAHKKNEVETYVENQVAEMPDVTKLPDDDQ